MILKDFTSQQKTYLKYYAPITLDLFLSILVEFLAVLFAAHIGPDYYVTGVGIASQVNLCTLFTIMYGYSTVFECYGGPLLTLSGKTAVGLLLVKCTLQGCLVYLVTVGPYLGTIYLVPLFGDEEDVQAVAVLYIKLLAFRPILLYFRELLMRYLITMNYIFVSFAVSLFVCLPLYILLCWFTVIIMKWGLYGLALSQNGVALIYVLLQLGFCVWKRKELDFPALEIKKVFEGWWQMVKLGILSSLRMLASWAMVAVVVLVCQASGPVTATAVIILDRIQLIFNVSVYAGGYATAMLVGTAMGAQNKEQVKDAAKIGALNLFLDRAVTSLLCLAIATPAAKALSDDPEVVAEVQDATFALILTLILLGCDEYLARGILTPFAKQAVIAFVTPVAIYAVALPVLLYLVFVHHVEAYVYFMCISLGYFIQCIAYIVRVCYLDVDKELDQCLERQPIRDDIGNETTEQIEY